MSILIYEIFDFVPPSPMEEIICRRLVKDGYKFKREIEFKGCINPITRHNLRFDFFLPDYSLIVEYDGKDFHSDTNVVVRDALKDNFAMSNNLSMIRLQGIEAIEYFMAYTLPNLPINKANCKPKLFRKSEIRRENNKAKLR